MRCRAGASRALVVSTAMRSRSRSASSAGVKSFARAAASSRARGRPSSRWQISVTACALAAVTAKVGCTQRTRATSIATAGTATRRSRSATSSEWGTASGPTGNSRSAARCSRSRLVTSSRTPGQARSGSVRSRPAASTCSQLSTTSSTSLSTSASITRAETRPPGASGSPNARATWPRTRPGSCTGARSTKTTPSANRGAACGGHGEGEAGLADAGRAGEGEQPRVGLGERRHERREFRVPTDQGERRARQATRAPASDVGAIALQTVFTDNLPELPTESTPPPERNR